MRRMTLRRAMALFALAACAIAGVVAATAIASAKPAAGSPAAAGAASGMLNVRFDVQRFQLVHHGKRLVAHGRAIATYREDGVVKATSTSAITLRVQQAGSCKVLHLELGELHLELLGLIVNLTGADEDKIVLDISADPNGGILGSLFCQLAKATASGATTQAKKSTRKLNAVFAKKYGSGIAGMSTPLTPQQTSQLPSGQCKVLNLVLGPLYLNLLGLIVQLNKIELDITANPTGVLGSLFCSLAGGPTTTGTSTTGPTTTAAPPPEIGRAHV